MKVRGDFLGPPRSTDKTTLIIKVSKVAKIRNRYNQVTQRVIFLNFFHCTVIANRHIDLHQ